MVRSVAGDTGHHQLNLGPRGGTNDLELGPEGDGELLCGTGHTWLGAHVCIQRVF